MDFKIHKGDYYEGIPYDDFIRSQKAPDLCHDIRSYGAMPGTISTDAIQRALDDAGKVSGTVLIAGGEYISGTITIPDGVTLFIASDAVLKASTDIKDLDTAFIAVKDVNNVRLTGSGRIHCQGEHFVYPPRKRPLLEPLGYTRLQIPPIDPMGYPEGTTRHAYRDRIRYAEDKYNEGKPDIPRPSYTVWVRNSKAVRIDNIIIQDAFSWTLSIDCSEDVHVEDIVIDNNRHVANTDGIDVMGSDNVRIHHCFISTADDGLCVKAPRTEGHDSIIMDDIPMKGVSHVDISDCTVMTVMNAFKIGTETYHDISDIHIHDCRFLLPDIFPGSVSGISIESADGSRVSDVLVEDIEMEKVMCPLFISLNSRNKFGPDKTGAIENVRIRNIRAKDAEVPSVLTGIPGLLIKDIDVSGLDVTYIDNLAELNIVRYENYDKYPESNALGDVPAYGIYTRHVDRLSLSDIKVIGRTTETREMIVLEDCHQMTGC